MMGCGAKLIAIGAVVLAGARLSQVAAGRWLARIRQTCAARGWDR